MEAGAIPAAKQAGSANEPGYGKTGGKTADTAADNAQLTRKTEEWLKELFSEELRIDQDQLETDVLFQDYGVDSIILAQLLQRINRNLSASLDPSILYEYPTIQSFANWLLEGYTEVLSERFDLAAEPVMKKPAEPVIVTQAVKVQEEPAENRFTGKISRSSACPAGFRGGFLRGVLVAFG